jgi:hypothetical protein
MLRSKPSQASLLLHSGSIFRLRGRETGEGEIMCDLEAGHLDFMDERCAAFKGVTGIPHCGTDVEFEGYKVPKRRPEPWESFFE